jgi:hypothetical protein
MRKVKCHIIKRDKEFLFLFLVSLLLISACNSKPKTIENRSAKNSGAPSSSKVNEKSISDSLSAGQKLSEDIQNRLIGKWQRSDGVYMLEILSATVDGKISARYFNPDPINVEKAEWKIVKNNLLILIVLRDVNYPGSTYTLEYSGDNNYLRGNYFQAVERTNYDVMFMRKK